MAIFDSATRTEMARSQALRLERRLLKLVVAYNEAIDPATGKPPPGWLLPFRPLLRTAYADDYCWRLAYLLRHGDPRLRAIVVSLLSRSTSRFRLLGIDHHTNEADPAIRKHVAKALRRLEARSQLTKMAKFWATDEWVQRYARNVVAQPFADRLTRFVSHNVDNSHAAEAAGPSRMKYWAFDQHWYLSPPKSVWYLRRMLQRIQHWVRGRVVR